MKLSYRLVNFFLVIASVGGMAFALYLEHFKGLQPCPLCVFQRVGLIFMGLFAFTALLHNPKLRVIRGIYTLFATLSMLWSAAVAARHVWIQHLPASEVPSCGPGLNYLVDALPMKEVLAQVLTGSGECAKIDWTLLGQSMPVWSFLFFSVLFLVSFSQFFRKV